jgi:hypothetical protein
MNFQRREHWHKNYAVLITDDGENDRLMRVGKRNMIAVSAVSHPEGILVSLARAVHFT